MHQFPLCMHSFQKLLIKLFQNCFKDVQIADSLVDVHVYAHDLHKYVGRELASCVTNFADVCLQA